MTNLGQYHKIYWEMTEIKYLRNKKDGGVIRVKSAHILIYSYLRSCFEKYLKAIKLRKNQGMKVVRAELCEKAMVDKSVVCKTLNDLSNAGLVSLMSNSGKRGYVFNFVADVESFYKAAVDEDGESIYAGDTE